MSGHYSLLALLRSPPTSERNIFICEMFRLLLQLVAHCVCLLFAAGQEVNTESIVAGKEVDESRETEPRQ